MSIFEKARGSSLWIELPHALLSELAAAVSRISCYSHSPGYLATGFAGPQASLTDELIQLRGVELLVVQVCCVGRRLAFHPAMSVTEPSASPVAE